MGLRARLVLVAVAVAAGCAWPSGADARWVRSNLTASDSRAFGSTALGFDARGRGMAAWTWAVPGPAKAQGYGVAFRDSGGRWSPARHLRQDDVVHVEAAYGGRGNGVLLLKHATFNRFNFPDPGPLTVRLVRGRRVGAAVALDPGHLGTPFDATVAMDRSGRALIAWTRGDRRDGGVYVRELSASGKLGAVERLEVRGRVAAVALNDRGGAAVGWEDTDGSLRVRVRPRSGAPFRKRQVLGEFGTEYSDDTGYGEGEASLAMSPSGRVLAGWSFSTLVDIGPDTGSELFAEAFAASAPPGARFGRPVRLEKKGSSDDGTVQTAFTPGGRGIVVWSLTQIRYALTRSARIGPRRTLDANGLSPALAAGPGGELVVAWDPLRRQPNLHAARLAPGRVEFERPQPVRGTHPGESFTRASVAYDPRSGRPTVVWAAHAPSGRPRDGSAVHSAARR